MEIDIELRPARPTEDEGLRFARYSNQASHGIVQRLFGKRYERILSKAYQSGGHDSSYDTAVFAVIDDQIVGMSSSYSGADHAESSMRPVMAAAGVRALRVIPFGLLGARLFRFIGDVPEDDYYLAALAVDDDRRGLGIGSALLDDVERRAREAGCRRLVLDVAADNPEAQKLYERRGMAVEAESPPVLFMPDQKVRRMVKELEGHLAT